MSKFIETQRRQYDMEAGQWSVNNRNPVVGVFDLHNNWQDYIYLFLDNKQDTKNKIMLDFGCGPGRNIVKYNELFYRIDGVDLSLKNLENALLWIKKNNCKSGNLFLCGGSDIRFISECQYDFVMSTICFQHICVYDIRKSYLREFFRVLKSGGVLTMQMGFGGRPGKERHTAAYKDNVHDASGTNGQFDVSVMNELEVKEDLDEIGFVDFKFHIRPVGPGDCHKNWIFFNAKKP